VKLIDSHAHLDDPAFNADRAVLLAALHANAIGVITIGTSLRSSRAACCLAARHRSVWATVGVHPHNAKDVDDATLAAIAELARTHGAVAVGEIGLDYYRDLSPRVVQRRVFAQQLALASQHGLPVVLHNREATQDILEILASAGDRLRGVVHSFLGDAALAGRFLDLGLHLGIGGPLTFPRNQALRDAVMRVPLDRVLVETDCPYLTPVPHRGHRNEPAYVQYIVEELARLRGIDPANVATATTDNAMRLFSLTFDAPSRQPPA